MTENMKEMETRETTECSRRGGSSEMLHGFVFYLICCVTRSASKKK